MNENKPKRFLAATQLTEEERAMLDTMLQGEKEKIKKILPDLEARRLINDSSFLRDLIKKEYSRRKRQYKKVN